MADIFSALAVKNPKNAYFQRLLEEGTSTAPIGSHWQGASRLAHALLAGLEMRDRDKEEQAAQALRMNLPGLGDSSGAPAAAPAAAPMAPSGDMTSRIISAENSTGNPAARNPNSSAMGNGQFINSTWLETVKKARPDLAAGKDDATLLAMRSDPTLSREMTEAYANQNRGTLSNAGLPVTPGATYLAHFAGPGGATKILSANPNARVADLLSSQAIKANPHIANMTAGDIRTWADRKMGRGEDPAALPPNAQPAQFMVPGQTMGAPPNPNMPAGSSAPPQRAAVQIDPGMAKQIKAMLASKDPAIQQQGMELYKQFAKPREETRQLTDPNERRRLGIQPTDSNPYQIDAQGKISPINPQPFNVNVNNQGASAFETEYGQGMAKDARAVLDRGNAAAVQQQRIMLAQKMLQDVQTGKLTPIQSTVGGYMQALGIDPKLIGIDPKTPMTSEALTALTSELVVGKIGSGGFPANNFSNPDREFLVQGVFSLADRPEANQIKLEVARRVAALDQAKADAWADARGKKQSFEEFERDWRKKVGGQSIFGDLIEQAKALSKTPGVGGGGAPKNDPLGIR